MNSSNQIWKVLCNRVVSPPPCCRHDPYQARKCRVVQATSLILAVCVGIAIPFATLLTTSAILGAFVGISLLVFVGNRFDRSVVASQMLWIMSFLVALCAFVIAVQPTVNNAPTETCAERELEFASRTSIFPIFVGALLFRTIGIWLSLAATLTVLLVFTLTGYFNWMAWLTVMYFLVIAAIILQAILSLQMVAQNQITQEKDNFDRLFHASIDPLLICYNGQILKANRTFQERLRVSETDIRGQKIDSFFTTVTENGVKVAAPLSCILKELSGSRRHSLKSSNEHDDFQKLWDAVAHHGDDSFPARLICRSIDYAPTKDEKVFLPDDGLTNVPAVLMTVRDVSLQIMAEKASADAAAASARSDAVSTLVHSLTHELRSPIWAVHASIEALLQDSKYFSAEHIHLMESMLKSATALLVLINDLLDRSKLEAGVLTLQNTDFSFVDAVEDVVDMLKSNAHEKEIIITCFISFNCPSVILGDPVRVKQVLWNLITNAIKFTRRGGLVEVHCRVQEVEGKGPCIVLRITDSGIGMDAVTLEKLRRFEKWTNVGTSAVGDSRSSGSGLGLFICHSLLEVMGGVLLLDSEYGKGSTFTAILPIRGSPSLAREPSPRWPDNKHPRILLLYRETDERRKYVNLLLLQSYFADMGLSSATFVTVPDERLGSVDLNYDIICCSRATFDLLPSTAATVPAVWFVLYRNAVRLRMSTFTSESSEAHPSHVVRLFLPIRRSDISSGISLWKSLKSAQLRQSASPLPSADIAVTENGHAHQLSFPESDSSQKALMSPSTSTQPEVRIRVHVIDDNEVSRRVTSKLISSCGAACDCSSNGFEAAVFMLEALCDTVFLLVPDVSARIGLRHHIARQLRLLHDRLHASGAFEDFKATVPLRTPRWDLLFSDESAVQFFPEHNRDGPAHEILSCMYGAHVHLVDQTMPVMLGGELAEFIRQFEKDFLPKLQAHLPHIANVSDYCARLIRFSAEPLAEDALFTAAVTKPVKKHALMDALQLHRYPSSVGRGDSGSNLTIRK